MKKNISILIITLIMSLFVGTVSSYAADEGLEGIISGMKDASTIDTSSANSGIQGTINNVIGLLQLAGTGISVIVVTMLGIKYLLASPSEKADTKKMIMPILIGCILLFGAVNLVAVVADFSAVIEPAAGSGATSSQTSGGSGSTSNYGGGSTSTSGTNKKPSSGGSTTGGGTSGGRPASGGGAGFRPAQVQQVIK